MSSPESPSPVRTRTRSPVKPRTPGRPAAARRKSAGKSKATSLFETLRDRILSGEYAVGICLPPERELAVTFGVNRGAVREAINRLTQARLASTLHGGGTRVENFRATAGLELLLTLLEAGDANRRRRAIRSLMEMHTALAVDAARLAAHNHTEAQLTALRLRARELPTITDDGVLHERLLAFWEVIAEASGNIAYRLAFNTLREGYRLLGKTMHRISRDAFNAPDYRVLLDAIAQHDAQRSERGARRIVDKEAVLFLERLANL